MCRLQVLVEVETSDGRRHSLLLQNAETVKLVGPQRNSRTQAASGNGLAVPPSLVPGLGGNGASALVLTPQHILAQEAALAARSWAMNSHESSIELDDDDEDVAGDAGINVATEGNRVEGTAAGTAGVEENRLPPPQRLSRQGTGLLQWVLKPAPEQAEKARTMPQHS
jgi:hypothetical protein